MGKSYYRKTQLAQINTKGRVRFWASISLVAFVLAGLLVYPAPYNATVGWLNEKTGWDIASYKELPFRLGLDLQGGTHLEYAADTSQIVGIDQEEAIAGVRDVIERRVNAIGVSEPLVQTTKVGDEYRVIVELAGISDVHEAINLIGETPLLEFKEENTEMARGLTQEERNALNQYNRELRTKAQEVLSQVLAIPQDFGSKVQEFSQDPREVKESGGSLGPIESGNELYNQIRSTAVDTITRTLVETDDGYSVVRVDAKDDIIEVQASHLLICFKGASRCETELSKEDALAKIEELKNQATPQNFEQLVKENSTEPGADQSGGDLGSFRKGMMVAEFEEVAFAIPSRSISDVIETQFGYHLIYKKGETRIPAVTASRIFFKKQVDADYVSADQFKNTQLSGTHLERAQVQFQPQTNEPIVALTFNKEGAALFEEITRKNLNKVVAIFLDGQIISAPRVQSIIANGEAVITGGFDIEEAKLLAQRLNAGALPVPIELIAQQTVGATLGKQSVADSLNAAMWGIILVALFMILFYRVPGVLAVISLAFYGVMLLALFKVLGVTLTLAGLAGVTLSLGMAVDANVLIFERLKEEIATGKPYQSAVDEAFKRAWSSIRDGNVSTLITTAILAWAATSFVKGFAVTLAIGVILSMFTAIVVTRILIKLVAKKSLVQKMPFLFLQRAQKGEQK